MSFASRLKYRREEIGLTQVQLAKILGVSKGAVGNYETGVSSPKAEVLYRLFDVLGCEVNYLFQDEILWLAGVRKVIPQKGEQDFIKKYRSLDDYGKKNILTLLDNEYNRCQGKKHEQIKAEDGIDDCTVE